MIRILEINLMFLNIRAEGALGNIFDTEFGIHKDLELRRNRDRKNTTQLETTQ